MKAKLFVLATVCVSSPVVQRFIIGTAAMRRILATAAALCLGGCTNVWSVKRGGQQQQGSRAGSSRMSEQISTSFIGNRKPDELLNAVALYFRGEGHHSQC